MDIPLSWDQAISVKVEFLKSWLYFYFGPIFFEKNWLTYNHSYYLYNSLFYYVLYTVGATCFYFDTKGIIYCNIVLWRWKKIIAFSRPFLRSWKKILLSSKSVLALQFHSHFSATTKKRFLFGFNPKHQKHYINFKNKLYHSNMDFVSKSINTRIYTKKVIE